MKKASIGCLTEATFGNKYVHGAKLLHDGQLLIIVPDGKTYTPDGKGLF
ncbi:MAG: hypothetical protein IJS13_01710 [Paludibacteraceae bacterium]|nr:hypothetical protein [Paludibacteraceae bacterium]